MSQRHTNQRLPYLSAAKCPGHCLKAVRLWVTAPSRGVAASSETSLRAANRRQNGAKPAGAPLSGYSAGALRELEVSSSVSRWPQMAWATLRSSQSLFGSLASAATVVTTVADPRSRSESRSAHFQSGRRSSRPRVLLAVSGMAVRSSRGSS